ncbi:MAG: CDP-glycerol glycerophosphotransferase family protein [Candidatus Sungbacteria bacterium]|uniref:CDP-glycerol glycerophosphotransferase family protein n=1 Tax=Candidatus Sungiibacteriota bacterium TaxID=2750080 RepID=A0A932YVQ3_9BACT|nr:CDP-glycerol glycerophosphotransferase family protein [Candidatus Sungbacteria bacterium]
MLNTDTMRLKARAKLKLDGRWGYYFFLFRPLIAIGASRLMRSFIRSLDRWLSDTSCYTAVFDAYTPNLVFSTDVQNEYDLLVMREAKRRGIPIVSKVRSWDNLTQWGLIRHIPDQLLVPTATARDEAIRYHDVSSEAITVVGVPHYDPYFRHEAVSREAFFKTTGLNPSKQLIMYAPVDDRRMRANDLTRTWMQNDLDRYILEVLAAMDANIWVRFSPNIPVTIGDFQTPPHMILDRPGVEHGSADITNQDLSPEDDKRLRDVLRWCDLVITGPSTIAIDAAIFDKPVILVNFTPTPRDFWHGIIEYRYNHIVHLVSSGGVRVVESRAELDHWIGRYLQDPSLDREGRRRLVREQCTYTDGCSSTLVAGVLLRTLTPHKA